MKAIILAAGYATRLFPLTKNFPKHLIPIYGKTILDYLMEKVVLLPAVTEAVLVTNDKYYRHFVQWKESSTYSIPLQILNDGTSTNEDRLGAIGDMQYAITHGHIDDDLLVLCADNLFDFDLLDSFATYQKAQKSTIVVYDVQDKEKAKRLGIVQTTSDGVITQFVEKPENPPSTLASSGIYFYPKYIIPRIDEYLSAGNNPDSPGNFPARLLASDTIYAHTHTERRYDVGTFDSLKQAKEDFGETNVSIEKLQEGIL